MGCCFHCTESFVTNTCHIPIKRTGTKWVVTGTFCTLSCALRFILDTRITTLSLFVNYINEVYGVTSVTPAKSRYTLSKFTENGLSISEFREHANVVPCEPSVEIVMSKLTSVQSSVTSTTSMKLYPSRGVIPLSTLLT